jgi:hypothetical protein
MVAGEGMAVVALEVAILMLQVGAAALVLLDKMHKDQLRDQQNQVMAVPEQLQLFQVVQ